MLSIATHHADGTMTIDAERVARWTRQVRASYDELSEAEKASDRAEADIVLRILAEANLS